MTSKERKEVRLFNLSYTFSLFPKKNLWHQPLFWLSLITPFMLFIGFGIPVWLGHHIDISADGYRNFYELSKLPLAILALCLPLGALAAKVFSSAQTAVQITENERKNDFELYYKHSEKFSEYLTENLKATPLISQIMGEDKKIFSNIHLMYADIFPASTPMNGFSLNCNIEHLTKIKNEFENAYVHLEALTKQSHLNVIASNYSALIGSVISIMSDLSLNKIYDNWPWDSGTFKLTKNYPNGIQHEYETSYIPYELTEWGKLLSFCHTAFGLVCKFCHADRSLYTFTPIDDRVLANADKENQSLTDFRNGILIRTRNSEDTKLNS